MEPDRQPISRAGRADGGGGEDGFTLLEIVCVVAIIAILAAIVLPSIPRGTSRARLESFAVDAAGLLKGDRNAAVRRRAPVTTEIDAMMRSIRSGATGRVLTVPDDVTFDAALVRSCNQRPAGSTIRFFSSGMSCGGVIALTRLGVGYQIRVNWLTGGIEVVPINLL